MTDPQPIHLYIPADPSDPRDAPELPDGVIAHRGPALHPDDRDVVHGLPVTSPSRTLIDLAEDMDADELFHAFAFFDGRGLLDSEALTAARSRVEWRPSLAKFDAVRREFGI